MIFLFNPRRTCGCIRREERRLDRARGYSELLHKGKNVSESNHYINQAETAISGSDLFVTAGKKFIGRVQRVVKHTPFGFCSEEHPHPPSSHFEEHEGEKTTFGLGEPGKTREHAPQP